MKRPKNNKIEHSIQAKGQYYLRKKEYKNAIEYYKKAVTTNKNAGHIYLNIASTYELMDDVESALENWKKAVEYNPKNIDAKISLANAYLKLDDIQNAIRKIRGAYKENKDNKKVLFMYGVLLLHNKEYYEAVEKLDEAIKIDSNYAPAKYAKIECLINLNKRNEAENLLNELEQTEPEEKSVDILHLRAILNESYIENENRLELIEPTIEICDKIISLYNLSQSDISQVEAIKNNLLKMKEN